MARIYPRLDANHKIIVAQCLAHGYSVWSTAMLGSGFPDLIVGAYGVDSLWEIKNPNMPPSKRQLTDDEKTFHRDWLGHVGVAEGIEIIVEYMEQFRK